MNDPVVNPYGLMATKNGSQPQSHRRTVISKSSSTLVEMDKQAYSKNHQRIASMIGLQGLNHDYTKTCDSPDREFKARPNPHFNRQIESEKVSLGDHSPPRGAQ